jgi:hypothetical protein
VSRILTLAVKSSTITVSSRDHGHDYAKDRDRSKDYSKDKDRDRYKGTVRDQRSSGRDPTTPDRRSHSREKVDDHKKRAGDSRDKKGGQDIRERRRDSSPHPVRDRSGNCECTQVADDYTNVCAFFDAAPVAKEADRAEDRLLSASIPHPSRNPRIPSLHVDLLPDTGAWSADYYINEATAAWLRSVGIKRKECSVMVCSGIGTPQQFCVPCRVSYTFDLIIYNDLLADDETISITANEIPTIKQNNISLKRFRFFSNLETGESLRGFVSYNLYATSLKSHLCSASFSAPTAVAKPQATVDFRG